MISGEYNINYDKTEYSERTMELNLVIVTAEDSGKSTGCKGRNFGKHVFASASFRGITLF